MGAMVKEELYEMVAEIRGLCDRLMAVVLVN